MTNPNPNKQQIPGGHALQKAVSRNYLLRDASDALRENVPNLGQIGAADE